MDWKPHTGDDAAFAYFLDVFPRKILNIYIFKCSKNKWKYFIQQ